MHAQGWLACEAPVTTIVFWERTAWTCTAAAMLFRFLRAALTGDCGLPPRRSFREARQRAPTVQKCGDNMQQICVDQVSEAEHSRYGTERGRTVSCLLSQAVTREQCVPVATAAQLKHLDRCALATQLHLHPPAATALPTKQQQHVTATHAQTSCGSRRRQQSAGRPLPVLQSRRDLTRPAACPTTYSGERSECPACVSMCTRT